MSGLAVLLATVVLLAALIAVSRGAGGASPPASGAAAVIPGDALAYVHVSTDPARGANRDALALAHRFPDYSLAAAAVLTRLDAILGGTAPADFQTQVRPWLGKEAAVAMLNTPTATSESLILNASYEQASAGEPAGRVLDMYASRAGVERLLVPQHGIAGALGALLSQPALAGVTISLTPASRGIGVRVHSALVSSLAALHGAAAPGLRPSLPTVVPSGSMLMLDSGALDAIVPRILSASASTGIGGQIGPMLSRLGAALSAQGVNVHELVSIFHGESALAVVPTASRTPALIMLARTQHPRAAQAALTALEAPLAELFAPPGSGAGQAPVFNDAPLGGTTVHLLSLAPGLQFDYAVSRGLLIISTSVDGIRSVLARGRALEDDAAYRTAVESGPTKSTSLLFVDFSQLLSLGEQTGLARSAGYGVFRADLEKVRAIGLHSTSGKNDSTAELFLQIS